MARLPRTRVLLVGLQGVGVETAKCLLLAGVGRLSLLDSEPPSGPEEASANFAIPSGNVDTVPLQGGGSLEEAGTLNGETAGSRGAPCVPRGETEEGGEQQIKGRDTNPQPSPDVSAERNAETSYRRHEAASRAELAYSALERLTLPHSQLEIITNATGAETVGLDEKAGVVTGKAWGNLKDLLASTDVVVLSNRPIDEVIYFNRLCREIQRERREAGRRASAAAPARTSGKQSTETGDESEEPRTSPPSFASPEVSPKEAFDSVSRLQGGTRSLKETAEEAGKETPETLKETGEEPAVAGLRRDGPYVVAVWAVGLAGRLFVDFGDSYRFGPPTDAHIDLPLASRFSNPALPSAEEAEGARKRRHSRDAGREDGQRGMLEAEERSRLEQGKKNRERQRDVGDNAGAPRNCRLHFKPLDEALEAFQEPPGVPTLPAEHAHECEDSPSLPPNTGDRGEEDEETKRQRMLHVSFRALDSLLLKRRKRHGCSSPVEGPSGDSTEPENFRGCHPSFAPSPATVQPSSPLASSSAELGRFVASFSTRSESRGYTGIDGTPASGKAPLQDSAAACLAHRLPAEEEAAERRFVAEEAVRLWRQRRGVTASEPPGDPGTRAGERALPGGEGNRKDSGGGGCGWKHDSRQARQDAHNRETPRRVDRDREENEREEERVRQIAGDLYRSAEGHLAPIASIMVKTGNCSVVGRVEFTLSLAYLIFGRALAAQEAIKALSGRFTPFHQFFYFDALDILPIHEVSKVHSPHGDVSRSLRASSSSLPYTSSSSPLWSSPSSSGSSPSSPACCGAPTCPFGSFPPRSSRAACSLPRWIGQERLLGEFVQKRLGTLHLFLAGAGAVGCELLKLFALMGVGCGPAMPRGKRGTAQKPTRLHRGPPKAGGAAQSTNDRDSAEERQQADRRREGGQERRRPLDTGGETRGDADGEEDRNGGSKEKAKEAGFENHPEERGEEEEEVEEGCITVADADLVERSNLNRQLLFTEADVHRPKAVAAAHAARRLNPALRIRPVCAFVGTATEREVFNWPFWKRHHLVAMALDTVAARMYLDSQCLLYQKPLVEAGTLGLRGHAQALVPHLTESYGSTADPRGDDDEGPQATCSVRLFPSSPLHLVQWASEAFHRFFVALPESSNAFLVDLHALTSQRTRGGPEHASFGKRQAAQKTEAGVSRSDANPIDAATQRRQDKRLSEEGRRADTEMKDNEDSFQAAAAALCESPKGRRVCAFAPRRFREAGESSSTSLGAVQTPSDSQRRDPGEAKDSVVAPREALAKAILNSPSLREVTSRSLELADILGAALDARHVLRLRSRRHGEEGDEDEGKEGRQKEGGRGGEGRDVEGRLKGTEEREERRGEGRDDAMKEKLMCFFVDRALGLFHKFFVAEVEGLRATSESEEKAGDGEETLTPLAEKANLDKKSEEDDLRESAKMEQRHARVKPLAFSEDDSDSLMFICSAAKLLSEAHGLDLDFCAETRSSSELDAPETHEANRCLDAEGPADGGKANCDYRVVRKLLQAVQRFRGAASMSAAARDAWADPLSALAWLRGQQGKHEEPGERPTHRWRQWISFLLPVASRPCASNARNGLFSEPVSAATKRALDHDEAVAEFGNIVSEHLKRSRPQLERRPDRSVSTLARSLRLLINPEMSQLLRSQPCSPAKPSSAFSPEGTPPAFPASAAESSAPAVPQLIPMTYNKDSPVHLSFLTATARLRARCFLFSDLPDLLAVQQLSGRIVPATSTATTVAAGLAALEVYRLVQASLLSEAGTRSEKRRSRVAAELPARSRSGRGAATSVASPSRTSWPSLEATSASAVGRERRKGVHDGLEPCLVMEANLGLSDGDGKSCFFGAELVTYRGWHQRLPRTRKRREKMRQRLRSSFFNLSAPFLTQAAPLAPPSACICGGQLKGRGFTPWDCLRLALRTSEGTSRTVPRRRLRKARVREKERAGEEERAGEKERAGEEERAGEKERAGEEERAGEKEAISGERLTTRRRDDEGFQHQQGRQAVRFLDAEKEAREEEDEDEEEARGDVAASLVTVEEVVRMLEDTLGVRVVALTCEDSLLYARDEAESDLVDWRAFWPSSGEQAETNGEEELSARGGKGRGTEEAGGRVLQSLQRFSTESDASSVSTTTLSSSSTMSNREGKDPPDFRWSPSPSAVPSFSRPSSVPEAGWRSLEAPASLSSTGALTDELLAASETTTHLPNFPRFDRKASLADAVRTVLRRTRGGPPASRESDSSSPCRNTQESGGGQAANTDGVDRQFGHLAAQRKDEDACSRRAGRTQRGQDFLTWVIVDVVAVDEDNNEVAVPQLKLCISMNEGETKN
ncbi:ThiF family protein [Toxoplasma gondii]|uniref:ThiF family protein n=1 Tax=Toxoplasma gondii TaxID=5811 RepID=A0A7J6JZ98_TOXGO|nr:ThiF family protein [Toxoplasma gondii]